MAKAKHTGPVVLTANDLLTGLIVYWTGTAWSRHFDEAQRGSGAEARATFEAIGQKAEAANEIVGPYLVVLDEAGASPIALRERQRHAGPLSLLSAA